MKTIRAIDEKGVFRPTEPVELPEGSEVTIEPRLERADDSLSRHQERIYQLLSESVDTGDPTLCERHDEHQP